MISKKIMLCVGLAVFSGVHASGSDAVEQTKRVCDIFDFNSDYSHFSQTELVKAFKKLGMSTLSAVALLNNSLGRAVLASFLSYKAFKNIKKAFKNENKRITHSAQAAGYLGAVLMLMQDGYTWLLRDLS